ncbi:class I SAM-dependent methyltransferase [Mesorhizobium sp. LjNodule214]|uniref:class I SAM-dependent methyltransferase n=1 Tax=Mesorhizobium sp. LjNodule214 TaxID=3342252 RepID=UPI003ECFE8C2
MAQTQAELATINEFEASYRNVTSCVMQSIERRVCGCDYGGTSWTTRDEAETMGRLLALAPGKRLLEIGAGAGWPSLYLAKLSGCSAVLTDLPLEGLRVASERAERDGLADRCIVMQADGAALPVGNAEFDAVSHSDVLCCLADKAGVLKECRRAVRDPGRMAFTVIYLAAELSDTDHAEAVAAGPPFVESEAPYEAMLSRTGWRLISHTDLTSAFAESMRRWIEANEASANELEELVGAQAATDSLARARQKLPAIERRLLRRGLFVAEPV